MLRDDDPTIHVPSSTFVDAAGRSQADDALAPGTEVGHYVVQRVIASGGGGIVHHAIHKMLGRSSAIKVLRRAMADSSQMIERFLREARAANMIRHPNIVDVFEFGELPDGRPFYVMEFLEGSDLRRHVEAHGRFAPHELLAVLEPVCAALDATHAAGIVHRDLKGSNIHIGRDANGMRIKLLDFGVAKLLERQHQAAGGLTSTAARSSA